MPHFLNAKQLASFQDELMDQLVSLREEIAAKSHDPAADSMMLDACHAALERIKDNRYGFCEQCGEELEMNRLNADPCLRYCLSCEAADKAG